jgi:hypothetical protein
MTQDELPYFRATVLTISTRTQQILRSNSSINDYRTALALYASVHVGIFRRLNEFWLWVVDELLEKDICKYQVDDEQVHHCLNLLRELLTENCRDEMRWWEVEMEIEATRAFLQMLHNAKRKAAFSQLKKVGAKNAVEVLEQYVRSEVSMLVIHTVMLIMAIVLMSLEGPQEFGQFSRMWADGIVIKSHEAVTTLINLITPELVEVSQSEKEHVQKFEDDMSLAARCNAIIDKLCEVELLRRIPIR